MTRRRLPFGIALALLAAAVLAPFAGTFDLFEAAAQARAVTAIGASPQADSQPPAFADASVDDVLPADAAPRLASPVAAARFLPLPPSPEPRPQRRAGPDVERGPPAPLS